MVVFFLLKSHIVLCKQIFMSVTCVGRSQTLGVLSKSLMLFQGRATLSARDGGGFGGKGALYLIFTWDYIWKAHRGNKAELNRRDLDIQCLI